MFARIATPSLFLLKGNKNSIRKKALKMNPKDAQTADAQENNKETAIAATAANGKIVKQ